jgi:DNA-binding NarL/FixJ family response regulator/signal transduction histidine kinase
VSDSTPSVAIDPAPATREEQITALLGAMGEVIDGRLEPRRALDRLSAAVQELVPHDRIDIGWLEEGGKSFRFLRTIAELPECERPGEPERVDGSSLVPVLRDGAPLLVPDYLADRRWPAVHPRERRMVEQLGLRACVAVPLRLGQRTTGLLELHHRLPGAYTAEHVAAAQAVADRIAPIVEALHLFKLEHLARAQLATVIEISHAISASLDLDEILPVIGRSLIETLGLPTCAIYLYDEDRRALVPRASFGSGQAPPGLDVAAVEEAFYRYTFPVDEQPGGMLARLREPLVIDRPDEYPWFPADFRREVPFVAVMDVPFVVRDRLVGLAALPLWEEGRGFSDRQLKLAMGIAQSAAVAIEHARLYGQARELGMAEERNRLAREVHDTLAQDLTAIALQLEAAERSLPDGAEAKRLVAEARDLARRSLDEARRAVWGLAPSPLDGRSLPEALANQVAQFGQRAGLPAAFTYRGDGPPLDGEQAAALLRIAQEALHNVEKHAAASRVRVDLEYQPGPGPGRGGAAPSLLTLLVADDGRGFDPNDGPSGDGRGGFGLTSMRERTRLIGGELDVESAVGWGTRVRVRLPLAPAEPAHGREPTAPMAAPPAPVRVLLVDDHPLAREGVRRLLDGCPDIVVVGEASDGVEGVERALALRPDVVLMDLQMPRLSGVGALRALRESWPDARVLILTTFAQDEHLFEALRAGARGYLLKDAGSEEVAAAIRTVRDGGSLVQPVMAERLLDRFGQLATREQIPEPLTDRELEVLGLAASGARNKEIAERLVVSEKTIKYHLGQIYAKLAVAGRGEAVARARQLGLLALDALPTP